MQTPIPLDQEARRLAALHALDLLDSDPEPGFEALVALATQLLDCPTALLTLVDRDRQWVKARHGDGPDQTPRSVAFCDYTIRQDEALVVEDATRDARFACNPLVTGQEHLRFYAGAAIRAVDSAGASQPIGAICVLDKRPRTLDAVGRRALKDLAGLAEALIAARAEGQRARAAAAESERQSAEIRRRDLTLRQAERIAMIGSWRLSIADDELYWSDGVYRIHQIDPSTPLSVIQALDHYPPESRARVSAALACTIETGAPYDLEEDFFTALGERRRVHSVAELETVEGRPVAITGVIKDITDRHELEMQLRRSADTDGLTGIANRAAFDRALEDAMARHGRRQSSLLLALVDLDGFKAINDTLGHLAGDDVLRAVGRVLQGPWLARSFAARLGGDEFALIVEDPALVAAPERLRHWMQDAFRLPVTASGITMTAAGTVGLALADHDVPGARDLVRRADADLYARKRARVGERRREERRAG